MLTSAHTIPNIVSMIRKYHNHKPQTTLWHREEESLNQRETPGRQIKQIRVKHRHLTKHIGHGNLHVYIPLT